MSFRLYMELSSEKYLLQALNRTGTLPVQLPIHPLSSSAFRINSLTFEPTSKLSTTVISPNCGQTPQVRKIKERVSCRDT
jgi:hypothetical protein